MKKTKIVCTLGPASDSITEISRLVSAGMNVARLNFSHGIYAHHKKLIQNVRKVEKTSGKTISILQDLQGPKIRIGDLADAEFFDLKEGKFVNRKLVKEKSDKVKVKIFKKSKSIDEVKIKKNEILVIYLKKLNKSEKVKIVDKIEEKYLIKINKFPEIKFIPSSYPQLGKDAKKDHRLLINDGLIECKILEVNKSYLICKTHVGGIIKSRKGINLPDSSISAKTITKKDQKDLEFGLKNKVDFIALSFVKSAKDIKDLKKLIEKDFKKKDSKSKKNKFPQIIAKIERHEAVKNLGEIADEADGLMVARGDLGVDIPAEKVPIIQKKMIYLANQKAKPIITATQVLQSMVENSRATRAEISDAANAVFDGTDAIMLSNESAVGKYSAKATKTLSDVAKTIEEEIEKHPELRKISSTNNNSALDAACLNACELAEDAKTKAIVIYSKNGYTAKQISKYRPKQRLIVLTKSEKQKHQLNLHWGLNEIYNAGKVKNNVSEILKFLKKNKIIKKSEKLVIVCGANKKEKMITISCEISA